MSVTDSNAIPPVDELQIEQHGLTSWRPQYDGIEVSLGFRCVQLRAYRGDNHINFNLSPVEAKHLAELLSSKAGAVSG